MVHEADGIHVFWHSDVLLLLSGHKKPDLVNRPGFTGDSFA